MTIITAFIRRHPVLTYCSAEITYLRCSGTRVLPSNSSYPMCLYSSTKRSIRFLHR